MMSLLMQAAAEATNQPHFPWSATLVYAGGLIAAVAIGSIAWFNSKRPVGWENKQRPDVVPKVEKDQSPGV